ncbi:MAG: serine/threonine-protein kinase [Gemmatimonadota bacterium]|nr:serine/threonine-protein kinase [Gemmatimonadota bacterium]
METGRLIAHYRVLERLGSGAMGEVYRALDMRLEREVALKILPQRFAENPTRVARFEVEAKLLASLNHPNIATIYEIREVEGETLLVLELVEGEPLDRRLGRAGLLPVNEVLRIGRQVASALEAAHEKGIVHRDLKPANVMLGRKGTAKVLDFGIAQGPGERLEDYTAAWEADPESPEGPGTDDIAATMAGRLTRAGVLLGTAPYMSPEQVNGAEVDKRSDIWSFGCLIFELLTGRPPFEGESWASTLVAVLENDPDWDRLPDDVPPAFVKVLKRCLRKDADARLHDIADVRIEIDELAEADDAHPGGGRGVRALTGVLALVVAAVGLFALDVGGIRQRLVGVQGATFETIASIVPLPAEVSVGDRVPGGLFREQGAEGSDAFLSDAVPGTLAEQLRRVPGLVTRYPPTGVELASIDGDLGELAELYGAGAFLLPVVTAARDSLYVGIELQDAGTRSTLWREEFAGRRGEYLTLMRRVADNVRQVLRPRSASLLRGGPVGSTNDTAVLELWRGRYHSERYRSYHEEVDFELARSAFARALESDPRLADAAAEMALLYGIRVPESGMSTDVWAEMESWAERARSIDPSAGLGWSVPAGFEAFYRREGVQTTRLVHALRGASLAPDRAVAQNGLGAVLADYSLSLGAESFSAALALRPLLASARTNLVALLTSAGRSQEALASIEAARRIQFAQAWAVEMTEGSIRSMRGEIEEARPIVERLASRVEAGALAPVALLELQLEFALASGNDREADVHLATIVGFLETPETPPQLAWNLVVSASSALAVAGRLDSSFQVLQLGLERGLVVPYDYLELNPRLDALRLDPRYAGIAGPSRARFEELRQVLEEARLEGELPPYLESPWAALSRQLESS